MKKKNMNIDEPRVDFFCRSLAFLFSDELEEILLFIQHMRDDDDDWAD